MRRVLAVIVLMLMTVSAFLFPAAMGDNDSLKVVVLVEDKDYSVGTSGKVTVHVFDKGVHRDADSTPEVEIGFYPSREIPVRRVSEGVYQGTFTIQSEDFRWGFASISATATFGKSDDTDTTYNEDTDSVMIWPPTTRGAGLEVRCWLKSVSDSVLHAGTKVVVAAEVTDDGTPVTPSSFDLTVTYENDEGEYETDYLDYTNPSKGIYESEAYTIPDLPYSTDFRFKAVANYHGNDREDSVSVQYNHFTVVYHNISRGMTETTFEIYIAGSDGKPVKGAHIDLGYDDEDSWEPRWVDAGFTDDNGKARVTLQYDWGSERLDITGYANASGKSQRFSGEIQLRDKTGTPHPSSEEFEVVFGGPEKSYKPGQSLTREYVVFNNFRPWGEKEIYCYIKSGTFDLSQFLMPSLSAVEAKVLTTDSYGKLKLTLSPPPGKSTFYNVEFESATGEHPKPDGWDSDHDSLDGKYYSEDSDSFWAGNILTGTMEVKVETLNLGSPTKITATARTSDPPMATTGWAIGAITDPMEMSADPNWQVWSQISGFATKSGSTYSGSVLIPSFMPKDLTYTVGMATEGEEGFAYGFASLKPGQGTQSQGTGAGVALPMLFIGIALLFIIIIIAVAAVAIKRKRAKPAPETIPVPTQVTPASIEPSAFPQGPAPPPGTSAAPQAQPQYQPQPTQPPSPAQTPTQLYQQPSQPQPPPFPPTAQPPPSYPYQYGQVQYGQVPPYPPPPYPQQPPYGTPQQLYQTQPTPAPGYYPQAQVQTPVAQAPAPSPQPSVTPIIPAAAPQPPTPPQGARAVTLPNNTVCAFCNQWMLQGGSALLCSCGKCYHEQCARMIESCISCRTKLVS